MKLFGQGGCSQASGRQASHVSLLNASSSLYIHLVYCLLLFSLAANVSVQGFRTAFPGSPYGNFLKMKPLGRVFSTPLSLENEVKKLPMEAFSRVWKDDAASEVFKLPACDANFKCFVNKYGSLFMNHYNELNKTEPIRRSYGYADEFDQISYFAEVTTNVMGTPQGHCSGLNMVLSCRGIKQENEKMLKAADYCPGYSSDWYVLRDDELNSFPAVMEFAKRFLGVDCVPRCRHYNLDRWGLDIKFMTRTKFLSIIFQLGDAGSCD